MITISSHFTNILDNMYEISVENIESLIKYSEKTPTRYLLSYCNGDGRSNFKKILLVQ